MVPQIEKKLRAALSEGIAREADVVYVLAQTRKLLDDTRPGDPHFTLKLYCHWALHVDLHGPGTIMPFLRRVDRFVECQRDDKEFGEQHAMFQEFALFDTFRTEFRLFLASRSLPTGVCDEDARWHSFLSLYAGVIEDGSLSVRAQPGDLKLISGVTFTKGRSAAGAYLPFDLNWDIHLLGPSPRILKCNFRAFGTPGGTEMLLHGLQLPPGGW